jgi:uncharacterized protein YyaL (SSP411 family)
MEQNKWEYRENFHSTGCGDYDGCYEVTDGHVFLCTKDDPEDITETENALQQIARLMNESGCKFYSNNVLELNQHIEIQKQKYEIEDLQAKCDRYEKALKKISHTSIVVGQPGSTWCDTYLDSVAVAAGYNQALDNIIPIANEALAGGGEKEVGDE